MGYPRGAAVMPFRCMIDTESSRGGELAATSGQSVRRALLRAAAAALAAIVAFEALELLVGRALPARETRLVVTLVAMAAIMLIAWLVLRRSQALRAKIEAEEAERARAQEALLGSEKRILLNIYDRSPIGIAFYDREGRLIDMNEACLRLLGMQSVDSEIGTSLFELPYLRDEAKRALALGESVSGETIRIDFDELVRQRKADPKRRGELFLEMTITPLVGTDSQIGYLAHLQDVTDRDLREREIEHAAYHDTLTDLPNRKLLDDRLQVAMAQTRRRRNLLALLFIDFDDFKNVNDELGHEAGDQLLCIAAQRLALCLRKGDTLARMGGDEFMMLLAGVEAEKDAAQVALRVSEVLRAPISLGADNVSVSVSTGIAVYPGDGDDITALQRAADTAMYFVKTTGKDDYAFYSSIASNRDGHVPAP